MYSMIMGTLLVAVFIVYFVLAGLADRNEYEKEQRDKYGDQP